MGSMYSRTLRHHAVRLALITAAALALRIFFLFQVNNYYWYGGMAEGYHIAARNLADGRGYAIGAAQRRWMNDTYYQRTYIASVEGAPLFPGDRYEPTHQRPPGYSTVLALVYRLTGHEAPALWLQIAADSAVPVVLFLLAEEPFGAGVGLTGALLYALWPPFVRNSVHELAEAFVPALLALALLLLRRGAKRGAFGSLVPAGLALGALPYLRAEWLMFPPFLGVVYVATHRRARALVLAVCLLSTLLIAPWVARNYRATGHVFVTSETGIALWEGLGQYPNPWGAAAQDLVVAEELKARHLLDDPIGADAYFMHKVIAAVTSRPDAYAKEVLKRLPDVLFLRPDWGLAEYYATDDRLPGWIAAFPVSVQFVVRMGIRLVPLTLDLLFTLAALGGVVLAVRRSRDAWLLLAPPAFSVAVASLTFNVPRQVLPGLFPYCIFTALTLEWVRHRAGQRPEPVRGRAPEETVRAPT